jgi:hypothetical protein
MTRTADGSILDAAEAVDDGSTVPVRRLVAMAAIALALGVVALFTVLPGLAPPIPTRGQKLLSLDPKRVRVVDVVPRVGSVYQFVRKDGTWTLKRDGASVEVPADRLDGFLETLAGLTRLVVIDEPDVNLAEFGLAPPRAAISIRDGDMHAITIGDRNPPLTALYVQVMPSSNIELVGAVLLWEFDKLVALTKTLPVAP